jgi:rhodanese-related sulfurtransferase
MKTVGVTLLQAIILVNLAVLVGFGVNAVRGRNYINPCRDYFPAAGQFAVPEQTTPDASQGGDTDGDQTDGEQSADGPRRKFTEITLEQAVALHQHEYFDQDVYVFVDARADDAYEDGHIPGAIQCDYYRIEDYWPEVLMRAQAAEKIVVYCNGGDCEDSLYVCGELLRSNIPLANILLFRGGWQAWEESGQPIVTGREQ